MKVASCKQWTISLTQPEAEALYCVLHHYLKCIDEEAYNEEVCMDGYSYLAMNGFIASIKDELPEAM